MEYCGYPGARDPTRGELPHPWDDEQSGTTIEHELSLTQLSTLDRQRAVICACCIPRLSLTKSRCRNTYMIPRTHRKQNVFRFLRYLHRPVRLIHRISGAVIQPRLLTPCASIHKVRQTSHYDYLLAIWTSQETGDRVITQPPKLLLAPCKVATGHIFHAYSSSKPQDGVALHRVNQHGAD